MSDQFFFPITPYFYFVIFFNARSHKDTNIAF